MAAVGHRDPGQAVEQRRLARATRAHDRDDLAGGEREVDAAQRLGLSEALMKVETLEEGRGPADRSTGAHGPGASRAG